MYICSCTVSVKARQSTALMHHYILRMLDTSLASVAMHENYVAHVCNALQYLVVYLCIVAEANATAFFLDGSSMSNIQVSHANAMLCAPCLCSACKPCHCSSQQAPSHVLCCHVFMQCIIAHLATCAPETMYKACHSLQSVTDCCNKAS